MEYLQNGIAINAVNMPALSPGQYKAASPFIDLAQRLGVFASHPTTGNPTTILLTYSGRIAEMNTSLLRNAGLAGFLGRSTASKANIIKGGRPEREPL